ncbi:MAG: YihY/virulence factor BrkB family protein [Phycisphaerales bacterium]
MSKQKKSQWEKPAVDPGGMAMSLVDRSLNRVARRPGLPRQVVHTVQVTFVGLRRSQLPRMAAALAYRTIFGLIPVLVISLVVLRVSVSPEFVRKSVDNLIRFTGINEVTVKEVEEAPLAHAPDFDPEVDGVPEAAPASPGTQKIETWITDILERERSVNYGAIGVIGFLTLLYAAISMLVEVEKAFNQIYHAPEGRSWVRRITQYWTLMTLGVILLVASFYVQEKSLALFNDALGRAAVLVDDPGLGSLGLLQRTGSFIVTSFISSLLMFVVYSVMPNTRVQWFPALVGAVIAGVLWEAGKWGFREYVSFSTGYARLYGSIGLVPLFLMWIYVTWLIVLLGLQIAHSLQTYRIATAKGINDTVLQTLGLMDDPRPTRRVQMVDPAAILLVAVAVAKRFEVGKVVEASGIASDCGVDESIVAEMLEALVGAGILNRVSNDDRDGVYSLSRPPERIGASDLLALGEHMAGTERGANASLLAEVAKVRMQLFGSKTLADLMGRAPVAATPAVLPAPPAAENPSPA